MHNRERRPVPSTSRASARLDPHGGDKVYSPINPEGRTQAMSTADEKSALRKQVRIWRDGLSPHDHQALSEEVEARLVQLPVFAEARTVLVYAAFGSEVGSTGIVARILMSGRKLVMPRVAGNGLELCVVTNPVTDLAPGTWGIPEPVAGLATVAAEEINLFLLPGLAFDEQGGRLGYGRGFFDRVLKDAVGVRIGLAFEGQMVGRVPVTKRDEPVDMIITSDRVIRCGAG